MLACSRILHEEDIPPNSIRSKWIIKYLEDFQKANEKKIPDVLERSRAAALSLQNGWTPPLAGFWKVNTDAAWGNDPPSTGTSAVCRDEKGLVVGASAQFYDSNFDGPLAELKAIFEGLSLAKFLGCSKLVLESDCSLAIHFIQGKSPIWSCVEALVANIMTLASQFSDITFVYVNRKCNGVADGLAKWARRMKSNGTWIGDVLDCVNSLFRKYCISKDFPKSCLKFSKQNISKLS